MGLPILDEMLWRTDVHDSCPSVIKRIFFKWWESTKGPVLFQSSSLPISKGSKSGSSSSKSKSSMSWNNDSSTSTLFPAAGENKFWSKRCQSSNPSTGWKCSFNNRLRQYFSFSVWGLNYLPPGTEYQTCPSCSPSQKVVYLAEERCSGSKI